MILLSLGMMASFVARGPFRNLKVSSMRYRHRIPYSAFLRRSSAAGHLRCDVSEALPNHPPEQLEQLAAYLRLRRLALGHQPVFTRVSGCEF